IFPANALLPLGTHPRIRAAAAGAARSLSWQNIAELVGARLPGSELRWPGQKGIKCDPKCQQGHRFIPSIPGTPAEGVAGTNCIECRSTWNELDRTGPVLR